jgi:hypothetical protein
VKLKIEKGLEIFKYESCYCFRRNYFTMSALAGDQAKVAAYLAHHRVQELVSEAINDAVLANAPNPIAHIARRLAHAAGVGDLEDGAPPDRLTSLEELSQGRRDVGGSRHEESELRLDALSAEEARLAALLIAAGQQHVFADWPPAGEESAGKRSFFAQAAALDKAYPGGLGAYLANGRKLLAAARLGANPLEGWTPAPPEGAHVLQPGTLEFDELERLGTAELGGVAFVIPAGGMGERLGYSGVKFGLPAELSSAKCVFEIYCAYILAFERAAERARPAKGPVRIPLALMVSDDTRAGIEALLEAHGCFGLHPSQICLLHQEKVACFADADGALAKRGRYELETKPHGHGDVHFLLHRAGLAQRWLSEGRKWICFFQDTSTLYLATFLATLGASFKYELEMNSVCVPRRAREAIGAMAQLTHADGRALLASVEYNQLEPLLRASGRGADVADAASGLSPYPGNINKLLFQLPTYVAALEYSKVGAWDGALALLQLCAACVCALRAAMTVDARARIPRARSSLSRRARAPRPSPASSALHAHRTRPHLLSLAPAPCWPLPCLRPPPARRASSSNSSIQSLRAGPTAARSQLSNRRPGSSA